MYACTDNCCLMVSIPSAGTGSHFYFGCGVQFILARSSQNGTIKYRRSTVCLHTPHAVYRFPSASSQRVADFGGHGYRAQLEYSG